VAASISAGARTTVTIATTTTANTINTTRDEAIRESLQIKREFVRYASHEIRSPLNVLSSGLQLLKKDLKKLIHKASSEMVTVFESLEADVQIMIESTEAAVRILDNLLHYEHIESDMFKLDATCIPLIGCIKKRDDLIRLAMNSGINLEFDDVAGMFLTDDNGGYSSHGSSSFSDRVSHDNSDIDNGIHDKPLCLYADICRIIQVIQNLVTNSAKFSVEGSLVVVKSSVQHTMLLPETADTFSLGKEHSLTRCSTLCIEFTDEGGMSGYISDILQYILYLLH
jgi:signal transduction histidine kinase